MNPNSSLRSGNAPADKLKVDPLVPPHAPAKMGETRVLLPCGGCASSNPEAVCSPRIGWLPWGVVAGLVAWILIQRL